MLEKGKSRETLVEARSDTDVQIVRETLVHGPKTNEKRMIGESGTCLFSTCSQT